MTFIVGALFPLGFPELLVILVILVVIFGASKLPQLGKGLGEGIRNFKKGIREDKDSLTDGGNSKTDDS